MNSDVVAAAAFLDKNYSDKNWRYKINTDTLNMSSCKDCILGQLFGDYDEGYDKLQSIDYDGWTDVSHSFEMYSAAWKEYLKPFQAQGIKDGSEWRMRGMSTLVTVDHTFMKGTQLFVVFAHDGEPFQVRVVEAFKQSYALKPVYVQGQLYRGKDNTILMYSSEYPNGAGFYNLTSNSHDTIGYYEDKYGPLVPVSVWNHNDKPVIAKIG